MYRQDADLNNDGYLDEKEINQHKILIQNTNENKKEAAQRKMAWLSLIGLLIYPILIIAASYFGLEHAEITLANIASTYFVSVATIVAAFYGKEAYIAGKTHRTNTTLPPTNMRNTPHYRQQQMETEYQEEYDGGDTDFPLPPPRN